MSATTHTLKVEPPYLDALLDGSKTFEVRRNDRAFQRGDRLRLWEYTDRNSHLDCGDRLCTPPREVTATITYVYPGDPRFGGVEPGYVVLGIQLDSAGGTP